MSGTMMPPRKRLTPSTGSIDPNFGAKRIVDPNSGRQNLPLPTHSLPRSKYIQENYKNPSTRSRTLTSHPGWHKMATANASRCTSNTPLSPPPARGAPLLRRSSAIRRSSSSVDAHLAPSARTQSRGWSGFCAAASPRSRSRRSSNAPLQGRVEPSGTTALHIGQRRFVTRLSAF